MTQQVEQHHPFFLAPAHLKTWQDCPNVEVLLLKLT